MANYPDTDDSIEGLLEQRTRFEQWLAKLDATGDKAPAGVRQKVRADYESRLRGVIDRLRGHAATIAEELQRHQASQADLDGRRRGAKRSWPRPRCATRSESTARTSGAGSGRRASGG